MPEGHTLHALARDLTAAFAGRTPSVTSPQGRFADGAALLDGHEVTGASAWGKLLFVRFAHERLLHVHLGLIGTFRIERLDGPVVPPARGAVRVRLLTDDHVADLRGPMACQVLTPAEADLVVSRQGPDPLRPDESDPERAWERIRGSRRSVAELLMDQTVLAGVGNVYRCEVLWRHRVDPAVPGNRLRRATWDLIWEDLVRLMPVGVQVGRIVTLDDDLARVEDQLARGEVPDGERRSAVYRRTGEPCPRCGSRVRTREVAGRNLYWCGRCQRRH